MSARAPYLFISYRKADAGHAAGRLYSDLERELAPGQVFLDKERLEGGDAWPERLRAEVERATVMIVLVGKRWLRVQDPHTGDRRLNVPGDWVRTEIEIGLDAVPTVVPVLVDGAAPLTVASLQTVPSIKKLAELQSLRLRDEDWKSDIAALKNYLVDRGFVPQLPPRKPKVGSRVLDAAMPNHIVQLVATSLLVQIHLPDSEGLKGVLQADNEAEARPENVRSKPFQVAFPLMPDGQPGPLKTMVKLTSPDFSPPEQSRNLYVPPDGDSNVAEFLLTPLRVGRLLVLVELHWEDAVRGARSLRTECVAEAQVSPVDTQMNVVRMPISVIDGKTVPHSEEETVSGIQQGPWHSNGETPLVVADESDVRHTNGAESGGPYIVGRDAEVSLLKGMIEATRSPSILNIYGPAGIGKTTLCEKLSRWCNSQQIPSATVDLYSLFNVSVRAIACKLRDMLVSGDNLHVARWSFQEVQHAFRDFDQLVEEHDQIRSAITQHGDVILFFDKFGFLNERYRLSLTHGVFARREGLDKYLREVDGTLTESFVQGVTSLAHSRRLVLFVDTWEKLEHDPGVEEWLSTKLLPNLPSGATAVLFGRSEVQKFASRLGVKSHLLEALSKYDTKAYLMHHGLRDQKALDAVYELTKGYPLCLTLACELSRKAGGWDVVSKISVAPEAIAEELLKRLLEEEGVGEVREFLEKGIVAEWFDRGSIRYILGVSEARANKIYQRIRRYSFVRPHPYGLQFHEGIRDILRRRLEAQNKREYARLTKKWADYFRKSQGGHL